MNVTPIYLGEKCTIEDFLHRLWEQIDHYSNHTKIIEKNRKLTLEETINRIGYYNQEHRSKDALKLLNKTLKNVDALLESFHLVPTILWYLVSIYDKREEWDKLVNEEKDFFERLLNKNRPDIPDKIFNTISCVHNATMGMASYRAFNLDEALNRFQRSNKIETNDASPVSLIAHKANILTFGAMVQYSFVFKKHKKKPFWIKSAIKSIKAAESLFTSLEEESCHFIGRFHAIKALISLVNMESDGFVEQTSKQILIDAEMAHNHANRTKFGKIAGKYCEAFCLYRISKFHEVNKTEKKKNLREAEGLLIQCDKGLGTNQHLAKAKVFYLLNKVSSKNECYREKSNNSYSNVLSSVKDRVDEFKESGSWYKLPLN